MEEAITDMDSSGPQEVASEASSLLESTSKVAKRGTKRKLTKEEKTARRNAKLEQEKILIAERKEAALRQMKYLLGLCEKYSGVYEKNISQNKVLKEKNVYTATLEEVEEAKRQAKANENDITDVNVKNHLEYFVGGQLHPYQLEGVEWMCKLRQNAVSGILADEMGLGKTVQIIALISVLLHLEVTGPFMILAPLSTIPNWQSEFKRFAPDIPVVVITGIKEDRNKHVHLINKKYKIGKIVTYPVVVMSFQTPMMEYKQLQSHKWRYIIVDEGQRIKNPKSQLGDILRSLHSENRLILTGTPLQNNLQELWTLLNFILPEFFKNMSTFTELILMEDLKNEEKMIEEEQSNNLVSKMHNVLKPFMLRRLKKDVLKNMVPKKEITVYCPLTPFQRELYTFVLEKNMEGLTGLVKSEEIEPGAPKKKRKCAMAKKDYTFSRIYDEQATSDEQRILNNTRSSEMVAESDVDGLILDNYKHLNFGSKNLEKFRHVVTRIIMQKPFMLLRNIVNHPYLVHFPLDPNSKEKKLLINEDLINVSGKLLVLDKLLPSLKERGHKVLLFSQFTMVLDMIEEYMIMRNYNYRRLDGNSKLENRALSMKEFNEDPRVLVFLISTRAGGLGLNLIGADTVIFYDRDWNPQVDIQAQDRCHRIGQTKPIVVYTLSIKNTVDDQIVNTGKLKRVLEKVIISENTFKHVTVQKHQRMLGEAMTELRQALKEPEDDDFYIFSSKMEFDKLLDRSDMYDQMKKMQSDQQKNGKTRVTNKKTS